VSYTCEDVENKNVTNTSNSKKPRNKPFSSTAVISALNSNKLPPSLLSAQPHFTVPIFQSLLSFSCLYFFHHFTLYRKLGDFGRVLLRDSILQIYAKGRRRWLTGKIIKRFEQKEEEDAKKKRSAGGLDVMDRKEILANRLMSYIVFCMHGVCYVFFYYYFYCLIFL
jgi:hypothetical protein